MEQEKVEEYDVVCPDCHHWLDHHSSSGCDNRTVDKCSKTPDQLTSFYAARGTKAKQPKEKVDEEVVRNL